ncbi:hypothetical protein [Psychrobium sp. 1_MG-2023]|uniref:hypothetical protein n=1 Tax=Psychrobium sp. 1_MG-2023 TaxID=3062624 RepID=UPI0026CE2D25|nr:hypothetical protein [Psychrobium sp. 1_MG-2023]MDP2562760.1 hypothetical protein [Psychrobium sp. 1_MG-2023]
MDAPLLSRHQPDFCVALAAQVTVAFYRLIVNHDKKIGQALLQHQNELLLVP